MKYFIIALCAVIAYLLGSINTAIILSKLKGKDIRKEGSGNAGATNTSLYTRVKAEEKEVEA